MNTRNKGLLILLIGVLSVVMTIGGAVPAKGQGPEIPPTPTMTDQQVFDTVKQSLEDSVSNARNANSVVTNADNAVGTSNLLLRIASGSLAIGGLLVLFIAILGFQAGLRTLRETRLDLARARAHLAQMRAELKENREQITVQSAGAIRALALTQLGQQQFQRHNITGAIQMFNKAFDLDPNNRATNYFLGELYVQDRQLDKGIEHLQRVLAQDGEYAPAEAALGQALRLQGDQADDPREQAILYVQSEERLLHALQIDPTALNIHGQPVQALLGGLYKRQGRLDQAIYHYEEARKIAPHRTYPVVNLAVLRFMKGDVPQALVDFEQVKKNADRTLAQNPHDFWARLDCLMAAVVEGKTDQVGSDLAILRQQVTSGAPLISALADLERLKESPQPPALIDGVIAQLQDMIAILDGTPEPPWNRG